MMPGAASRYFFHMPTRVSAQMFMFTLDMSCRLTWRSSSYIALLPNPSPAIVAMAGSGMGGT